MPPHHYGVMGWHGGSLQLLFQFLQGFGGHSTYAMSHTFPDCYFFT